LSDRFELWLKGLKSETAKVYGRYARRLFTAMNLTPDEALEKVKQEASMNRWDTYSDLVAKTAEFTERGRYLATFALRSFLFKNGIMMLPPARTSEPTRVKDNAPLSWDDALAICAAASKPYNLAFKMMLHCGWGSQEFLRFNTTQNWEHIKTLLANGKDQEYVRVEMPRGRKRNRSPFYSLIPTGLLKEVLAANIQIPITASHGYALDENHKRTNKVAGIPLDMAHHASARLYLEKAFATALKRAPITITGKPTPHEMRDTFRTRAQLMACEGTIAEFAMGHQIDPLGYNKCYMKEAYVWENLKKIYGPTPALIGKVDEENKQLKERIQKLESEKPDDVWTAIGKHPEKLRDIINWAFRTGVSRLHVLSSEEVEQARREGRIIPEITSETREHITGILASLPAAQEPVAWGLEKLSPEEVEQLRKEGRLVESPKKEKRTEPKP
jgi:integrase